MRPSRVAILSVGDEISLGQIADTNARAIAERLLAIGCMPGERRTVGDDRVALADGLQEIEHQAGDRRWKVHVGALGSLLDVKRQAAPLVPVTRQGGAGLRGFLGFGGRRQAFGKRFIRWHLNLQLVGVAV